MGKDGNEESDTEESHTVEDSAQVNGESIMILPSTSSATEDAPKCKKIIYRTISVIE